MQGFFYICKAEHCSVFSVRVFFLKKIIFFGFFEENEKMDGIHICKAEKKANDSREITSMI